MAMTTTTQYKGRVWTCNNHDEMIINALTSGSTKRAQEIVASVHPKKGKSCKECARLYDETPPSNR